MTTSELAALAGVTPRRIDYRARAGDLTPPELDATGRRWWFDHHLAELSELYPDAKGRGVRVSRKGGQR